MTDWLKSYKSDREKAVSNRIGVLRLRPIVDSSGKPRDEDAKIARIRFISDAEDVQSFWVHEIPKQSRLGKRFNASVYCPQMNAGEACKYCDAEDFPKRKLYFYVYCFDILHVHRDADKKWEKIEYLEESYYSEPVNAPLLLITGVGKGGQTEDKFLNWNKRFKTLCDRNYDWTREGLGFEVHYDLVPESDKSSEPKEVAEAKKGLVPLNEIVEKMISKAGSEDKQEEEDEDNGGKSSLEKVLFD